MYSYITANTRTFQWAQWNACEQKWWSSSSSKGRRNAHRRDQAYKCHLHNIPAIFFKFVKFYMLLHLVEMSYLWIFRLFIWKYLNLFPSSPVAPKIALTLICILMEVHIFGTDCFSDLKTAPPPPKSFRRVTRLYIFCSPLKKGTVCL